jgi:hypothetical protein
MENANEKTSSRKLPERVPLMQDHHEPSNMSVMAITQNHTNIFLNTVLFVVYIIVFILLMWTFVHSYNNEEIYKN